MKRSKVEKYSVILPFFTTNGKIDQKSFEPLNIFYKLYIHFSLLCLLIRHTESSYSSLFCSFSHIWLFPIAFSISVHFIKNQQVITYYAPMAIQVLWTCYTIRSQLLLQYLAIVEIEAQSNKLTCRITQQIRGKSKVYI